MCDTKTKRPAYQRYFQKPHKVTLIRLGQIILFKKGHSRTLLFSFIYLFYLYILLLLYFTLLSNCVMFFILLFLV